MKTLKLSEQTHAKLTRVLGQLMADTGKSKTYEDAVEALLSQSVVMPQEFVVEVADFMEKNKQFGYVTVAEFLKDAARSKMQSLKREEKPNSPP